MWSVILVTILILIMFSNYLIFLGMMPGIDDDALSFY
jgi:hypothetical protein